MNFTEWLSKLDEFLYELVSWIVFFPVTLWKVLHSPLAMMTYAEAELTAPEEDRYLAALSPPIFLILAMLVAFAFGIAIDGTDNTIVRNHHGLANFINDDKALFFFRVIVFCLFPLTFAAESAILNGALDRRTLQAPFYAQCYAMVPFALALSGGVTLIVSHAAGLQIAGAILLVAAFAGYIIVQTLWFAKRRNGSMLAAFGYACAGFVTSLLAIIAVSYLIFR